jgi:dolichol-phosphate mannosyltransferase
VSDKKTLIFIPTYNERENVGPMCERIVSLGLDADILFMDDSSPDGTGQVLDELAARLPRVRVIHRAGKLGIGSAHMEGIELAYASGYDRLLTLDCDFTHNPLLIPQFLEQSAEFDVVVGSRFLAKNSLSEWPLLRRVLTNTGHLLMSNLLGVSQDATGAYRIYDLKKIPVEVFRLVRARGYAFFFESLFVIHRNGFSIGQIPMNLGARAAGASKMTVREVRRSTATLMTLFLQEKTDPERFRLARNLELNPELIDPQNWDEYWKKKAGRTTAAYDLIATLYRNKVIKPRLEAVISKEFDRGAKLLHAGCGSGQVDAGLHDHAEITAIDISPSALQLYKHHNPQAGEVRHASIFDLPFPSNSFDGAYNLGVVEHFEADELTRAFTEMHRVLKPGGKLVVFWPHARATSVAFLKASHWLLNDVLNRGVRFHPPEVSLVHSQREASDILATGGFSLDSYDFGPKDGFIQAVVVATRA